MQFYSISSNCANHKSAQASDGILKSPLGDTATLPTLGPPGKQERLNSCAKNRL